LRLQLVSGELVEELSKGGAGNSAVRGPLIHPDNTDR